MNVRTLTPRNTTAEVTEVKAKVLDEYALKKSKEAAQGVGKAEPSKSDDEDPVLGGLSMPTLDLDNLPRAKDAKPKAREPTAEEPKPATEKPKPKPKPKPKVEEQEAEPDAAAPADVPKPKADVNGKRKAVSFKVEEDDDNDEDRILEELKAVKRELKATQNLSQSSQEFRTLADDAKAALDREHLVWEELNRQLRELSAKVEAKDKEMLALRKAHTDAEEKVKSAKLDVADARIEALKARKAELLEKLSN